jgi:hypothetical protein
VTLIEIELVTATEIATESGTRTSAEIETVTTASASAGTIQRGVQRNGHAKRTATASDDAIMTVTGTMSVVGTGIRGIVVTTAARGVDRCIVGMYSAFNQYQGCCFKH